VTNGNGTNAGPFAFSANPTVVKTGGPAAGAFAITGGTCVSGFVISPGANCTITIQYTPPTTGTTAARTATSTAHVVLTGTGLAAATQNGGNFNGN
jgi:hypothetical protein